MQRSGIALRRVRRTARLTWPRSAGGFTLVELIAAVALLIILVGILFVVFGEASKTVSIGQTRLARYATVRGFFRLLEDDLANAFLMKEEGGSNYYGLVGGDAQDQAFLVGNYLDGSPVQPSDRLTLIRLRPSQNVAANRPGFVEACYLRRTYPRGQELVVDRRNCLFRVADEDMGVWTLSPPPHLFPAGFLTFNVLSPANGNNWTNNAYFQKYIVALDVSDLQFRYLNLDPDPANPDRPWQRTWDPNVDMYPRTGPGARPALPIAVEVTIRLGPDSSNVEVDPSTGAIIHDSFTQLIRLPIAP